MQIREMQDVVSDLNINISCGNLEGAFVFASLNVFNFSFFLIIRLRCIYGLFCQ